MIAQLKFPDFNSAPASFRTKSTNSSESCQDLYDALYDALSQERDRLLQNALPGSVHQGKGNSWERRYYCQEKNKTVYAAIAPGQQGATREACANWRRAKQIEAFLKKLVEARDKYPEALWLKSCASLD